MVDATAVATGTSAPFSTTSDERTPCTNRGLHATEPQPRRSEDEGTSSRLPRPRRRREAQKLDRSNRGNLTKAPLHGRTIMRMARSTKNRPKLLAELEERYRKACLEG